MKKLFITLLVALSLIITSNAQDYKTSLGLRGGLPFGITVKHFLNEHNALEGILATRWSGFVVTGLYEFERWTGEYPGLNWYFGAGAHLGTWNQGYNPNIGESYSGIVIGVDGVIGLEYTFDEIPLNLSLDLLPSLNLIGYTGWGGINGALSIRYVF
ncbi:MAG: hypothetical protein Q8868_06075 [Bacteroidota bacterium]|nr:hypothetical protein [Bacteroidota bacterium]